MGMLRLALGMSAIGWFGLAVNEWLRSRQRTTTGFGKFRIPASTSASEATRRAA